MGMRLRTYHRQSSRTHYRERWKCLHPERQKSHRDTGLEASDFMSARLPLAPAPWIHTKAWHASVKIAVEKRLLEGCAVQFAEEELGSLSLTCLQKAESPRQTSLRAGATSSSFFLHSDNQCSGARRTRSEPVTREPDVPLVFPLFSVLDFFLGCPRVKGESSPSWAVTRNTPLLTWLNPFSMISTP